MIVGPWYSKSIKLSLVTDSGVPVNKSLIVSRAKSSGIFVNNGKLQKKRIYINNPLPHSLWCTSITPPEGEVQHQLRKFVNKSPCPEQAFYFQIRVYCFFSLNATEDVACPTFTSSLIWFEWRVAMKPHFFTEKRHVLFHNNVVQVEKTVILWLTIPKYKLWIKYSTQPPNISTLALNT